MSPATNRAASPLVSVVIPVHNGVEFVDGRRRQTYTGWSYTIVDDSSALWPCG